MNDLNEVLILAVRNSSILWDKTDKRYHNRLLVDREWSRIADELGETSEIDKLTIVLYTLREVFI